MTELEFLVGTYTPPSGKGGGIHRVRVSTDAPEEAELRLVAEAADPSWITMLPGAGVVVAAEEIADGSRILTWRVENGALTALGEAALPGAGPCHVGAHPSLPLVATAHYGDGTAALWRIAEKSGAPELLQRFAFDGSGPVTGRQEASHAHFAAFIEGGRTLAITDLGGDAIHFYRIDAAGDPVASHVQRLDLPPGSGPRHMAEGRHALFVSCELDETVRTIVRRNDRYVTIAEMTPFSPVAGEGGALSGIRVSPDGTDLLVAGRNQNAIARLRRRPERFPRTGRRFRLRRATPARLRVSSGRPLDGRRQPAFGRAGAVRDGILRRHPAMRHDSFGQPGLRALQPGLIRPAQRPRAFRHSAKRSRLLSSVAG